ncbi:hypothetical protein [Kitasatospora sp. NPDC057015]|uniref:hypothetical protein n=1 Tax=Kitasatospora sp. NPDC057015 TaxID=3346001 RepID=UPI00363DBB1E
MAAPARASVGGYAFGTWLSELRASAQLATGEQGALTPKRQRAPEEIDPWWCHTWPITCSMARQW